MVMFVPVNTHRAPFSLRDFFPVSCTVYVQLCDSNRECATSPCITCCVSCVFWRLPGFFLYENSPELCCPSASSSLFVHGVSRVVFLVSLLPDFSRAM